AARVYNEYGPTEATVGCIVALLQEGAPVLIGRPIAGTTGYILDARNAMVPLGITGELCIAGTGVADGYFTRPEQRAGQVVDTPFRPGTRMYRTGDLGRWLPDGNIDFQGRKDDQMKIRGFRVEPGEVSNALLQHPAITNAVVAGQEGRTGDKELVAYIVAST